MTGYDVIVVGARCAGAPTAMLLARLGHRVLLVDRARFPSDTVSTHLIHPPGVAALRSWGLLDRLTASGCPPIHTYLFDLGPVAVSGAPSPDGQVAYGPRRTVLDHLLVEAAAEAGAEVREGFTVDEIAVDGGRVTGVRGGRTTELARVVVGADGRHSAVADQVGAPAYHTQPRLLAGYYTYWSDLPMAGRCENYLRPGRGLAAWPTNDGLTVVVAGWPMAEFAANRTDVERHYLATLDLVPAFAKRVRAARREAAFAGTAVHNYFRRPYGPGWALVGDAGYNRDFITAQGIQDAFRDAGRCATALHEALTGGRPYDEAMAAYQADRDAAALAMYDLTTELATLQPPPPEVRQRVAAAAGDQAAMDLFVQVNAGSRPPSDFLGE
jgi:2-polyprenyl-6-methoxyphenol hydroxylase-like FAD-dependent oxidoreductase